MTPDVIYDGMLTVTIPVVCVRDDAASGHDPVRFFQWTSVRAGAHRRLLTDPCRQPVRRDGRHLRPRGRLLARGI